MLQFSADNFDALELEAQERAEEVSVFTVRAVCNGLDADVDVVSVGYMKNLNMEITCERKGFFEALALNIKRCEDAEEYELCKRARIWIKKLEDEKE